jgi:hypothetical protein
MSRRGRDAARRRRSPGPAGSCRVAGARRRQERPRRGRVARSCASHPVADATSCRWAVRCHRGGWTRPSQPAKSRAERSAAGAGGKASASGTPCAGSSTSVRPARLSPCNADCSTCRKAHLVARCTCSSGARTSVRSWYLTWQLSFGGGSAELYSRQDSRPSEFAVARTVYWPQVAFWATGSHRVAGDPEVGGGKPCACGPRVNGGTCVRFPAAADPPRTSPSPVCPVKTTTPVGPRERARSIGP